MIRFLLAIPVFVALLIVAISIYLSPQDLTSCGDVPSVAGSCEPVDAIVAISGGDTNARTDEAIKLYKNKWSDTLVFSGAAQDKSGPSNAAAMRTRAISAGIPSNAILLDETAETTTQNAQNASGILVGRSANKIILITSGYHQRRANLEFTKQLLNVTIYNYPAENDRDWSLWWWTGPRGWTLAASELVKISAFYVENRT